MQIQFFLDSFSSSFCSKSTLSPTGHPVNANQETSTEETAKSTTKPVPNIAFEVAEVRNDVKLSQKNVHASKNLHNSCSNLEEWDSTALWLRFVVTGENQDLTFAILSKRYRLTLFSLAHDIAKNDTRIVEQNLSSYIAKVWVNRIFAYIFEKRHLPGMRTVKGEPMEDFTHWIKKVAKNECLKYLKSYKKYKNKEAPWSEVGNSLETSSPPPSNGQMESLEALIEQILGKCKSPWYLKLIKLSGAGYSNKDISEETGLTRKQVKERLYRARKKLWQHKDKFETLGFYIPKKKD